MNVQIRPERIADRQAIWNVNRAVFGTEAEANLVDALRAGGYLSVSLVAEINNEIVGHILFSKLLIITNDRTIEALSLAPMAVLPNHQRQGVGSKLIIQGLDECRRTGGKIALVLGHPMYYPRFGFSADLATLIDSPFGGGNEWMAMELVPGALTGVMGRVEYPSPFHAFA